MRRIERIGEILHKIKDEWLAHPDMRLGQLLITRFGYSDDTLFYTEDDTFGVEVFDPDLPNGFKESITHFRAKK
jgi:hypothetical protein